MDNLDGFDGYDLDLIIRQTLSIFKEEELERYAYDLTPDLSELVQPMVHLPKCSSDVSNQMALLGDDQERASFHPSTGVTAGTTLEHGQFTSSSEEPNRFRNCHKRRIGRTDAEYATSQSESQQKRTKFMEALQLSEKRRHKKGLVVGSAIACLCRISDSTVQHDLQSKHETGHKALTEGKIIVSSCRC